MSRLDDIITHGNRGHYGYSDNSVITAKDGFHISVIAGGGTYCKPRPAFCACFFNHITGSSYVTSPGSKDAEHDYPGPYTHLEIGFPSLKPEPWGEWSVWCENGDADGAWEGSIFAFVPVEAARALIELHGGES